jgi:hypothetical protein
MPQFSESIEISRPPEKVWEVLGSSERWLEGYVETRSRSSEYPGPETRNDHIYRTRMKEEVSARVVRSQAASALEEEQEGKTFFRRVRYTLSPVYNGTVEKVEDDVALGPWQARRADRRARCKAPLGGLAAEAARHRAGVHLARRPRRKPLAATARGTARAGELAPPPSRLLLSRRGQLRCGSQSRRAATARPTRRSPLARCDAPRRADAASEARWRLTRQRRASRRPLSVLGGV